MPISEIKHAEHGFPPIIDVNSQILILGSFPSIQSRKAAFFYMHPSNRFWRVLSVLLKKNLVGIEPSEKTRILLEKRIALYDVVESCDISGSSDSSIRNAVFAKIDEMIRFAPIQHIFLNGTKAFALFQNRFSEMLPMATLLPSTSSANAKTSFANLMEKWKLILSV
jgi:hypoxanthine-DNA glycosylase